jgi:hypothetical protein
MQGVMQRCRQPAHFIEKMAAEMGGSIASFDFVRRDRCRT